ncbi:dTDP-4-dehydrorhamnose reductase [Methanobrevibacter sp. DSM 116169]|uniref:dTDP-4-dehydrorhamnose reductase n=1 Tax=Methanobrevibacter sp. DSM 116169 TaxID=3242727 RepID=UPI0038FCFDB5
MKILITGADGMLGTDLQEVLKDEEIIATDVDVLDITDKKATFDFVDDHKPDIIINSAAYTDVDGCEENKDLAFKINSEGPKILALACKEFDIPLVHISTDYVFNGDNDKPWKETDVPNPISVYGETKLEAEVAIQEILDKFFILRTAWLYGVHGNCFPKTMLELSQNHDEISVVDDQVGSPTFTLDLATAISKLIKTDFYGLYHLTNSEYCSWYDFTKLIFKLSNIDTKVKAVTTEEFPRPAPRPKYSVLANNLWKENGFEPLRSYKEAIEEYLSLVK